MSFFFDTQKDVIFWTQKSVIFGPPAGPPGVPRAHKGVPRAHKGVPRAHKGVSRPKSLQKRVQNDRFSEVFLKMTPFYPPPRGPEGPQKGVPRECHS